jgi:hypothetical protein
MNASREPRRLGRSVAAVSAGFALIVATSLATDVALHATGVFPAWFKPMADHLWALATAYRFVYSVAGAYVTARLAPRRPMRHALVLGAIGLALSALGAAANWNKGEGYGPQWYCLSLIAIAIPSAWLGGWLRQSQAPSPA